MSTRKKSEQKGLNYPFKYADSQGLVDNILPLIAEGSPYTHSTILVWKNTHFTPSFSLGDIIGPQYLQDFNLADPMSGSQLVEHHQRPTWISHLRDGLANIVDTMWNEGLKFPVMQMRVRGYDRDIPRATDYNEAMRNLLLGWRQVRGYPNAPVVDERHSHRYASGSAPLIRRFFHGEGATISRIQSKVEKGEFERVTYIATRYYLAQIKPVVTNPNTSRLMSLMGASITEHLNTQVPLVVLVSPAEDRELVRASWLMEEPLDAQRFQLWVDKSLDDPSSKHPLRTQYIRSIRNPLAKKGVQIVIKDNLYEEAFASTHSPVYKTLKEEKEFAEKTTKEIMYKLRKTHRISIVGAPDPTNPAVEFPF